MRHRIGISFEQQSQRYVKFKQDKLAFVMPESWERAGMRAEFEGLLGTGDRRRRLREVARHLGQLDLGAERARAFFGVGEVVAPDAEDVFLRRQRR